MISYISGNILRIEDRFLVVENAGLGYKVFVTSRMSQSKKLNSPITLWTYDAVREDSRDLYGFETQEELSFFELLLTVSGIGPKTALNIISVATLETLRQAVTSGETNHLVKVGGIGKKVADKIVLELRGKLENISGDGETMKDEVDAIEALKSLGYSHKEAREALETVSKEITGTGERVKGALKYLGSSK